MLYSMKNPEHQRYIAQYGKAYGTTLLHRLLPDICRARNLFVFDSYEEFEKIEDQLPEVFALRADAKKGEMPTFRVEGTWATREDVADYIRRVKESNPNGVVLCVDNEEWTHEKVRTDGAFNVDFSIGSSVRVDFVGQGFDMGVISKGKESHETWCIDWDDILFLTPSNMNRYREHIITERLVRTPRTTEPQSEREGTDDTYLKRVQTNDIYLESAKRRLEYLLRIGYKPEELVGMIPKQYKPMSLDFKDKIIEQIIMPIYEQSKRLKIDKLTSFGVHGMIIDGKLFPLEVNTQARCAPRSYFQEQQDDGER